jgi:hypothetical protein
MAQAPSFHPFSSFSEIFCDIFISFFDISSSSCAISNLQIIDISFSFKQPLLLHTSPYASSRGGQWGLCPPRGRIRESAYLLEGTTGSMPPREGTREIGI